MAGKVDVFLKVEQTSVVTANAHGWPDAGVRVYKSTFPGSKKPIRLQLIARRDVTDTPGKFSEAAMDVKEARRVIKALEVVVEAFEHGQAGAVGLGSGCTVGGDVDTTAEDPAERVGRERDV